MHLRLMMEWKWGAGSVDGIDLATYYYCYCVHMICNQDLEWGWRVGMVWEGKMKSQ